MANKSIDTKSTNQKKPSANTKLNPKRNQKKQTASFDISNSTNNGLLTGLDKNKIIEEAMSPTKTTINLFESLANQYILHEKPFAEKGENTEKIEVLKSKLAPDIEEKIGDATNDEVISEDPSASIEASVSQMSTKNINNAASVSDLLDQSCIPESIIEDQLLETKPYPELTDRFDFNANFNEDYSQNNSFINYKSSPVPKEVTNAIQDAISSIDEKLSNEATINDLKVKIIEILNTPFPAEELDLASAYELDRLHIESLRELGESLAIKSDAKASVSSKPKDIISIDPANQNDVLIKKSYQKQIDKAKVIDKKTVETFYNSKGVTAPSKKTKSRANYSVTDLTGESLIINKSQNNTPRSSPQSIFKMPVFQQDKAFMDYNTEKELIEMAMKADDEFVSSKRINVIYLEDKESINQDPERGFFRRIFSCGC